MSTMKEAIVDADTNVTIIDSPIPKPGPGQVLIKVIVAGTNPKDWKSPGFTGQSANTGDDIAGIIEALGEGVYGFYKGQRVAAFHEIMKPYGAFAEYAVAPALTTIALSDTVTFEEGATVPLAAYTAATGLFYGLEFPSPWDRTATTTTQRPLSRPRPLLVYGASSAVGAFAIKLAKFAGVHPVIAVGSKRSEFIRPLLNSAQGDAIVDYTAYDSEDHLINAIKSATMEAGIEDGRIFDAIACAGEDATLKLLGRLLQGQPTDTGRKPRVSSCIAFGFTPDESTVEFVTSMGAHAHSKDHAGADTDQETSRIFGWVWANAFSRGLDRGWLPAHPFEVVPGGLGGLAEGLKGLRDGTVRAKKVVIRVRDTKGLEK